MMPRWIYSTPSIREIEKRCFATGVTGDELMQRAGRAAFDGIMKQYPNVKKMAVFCGAGNNGGDGYVVAKLARSRGMKVTVYQVGDHSQLTNEAANALQAAKQADVVCLPVDRLDVDECGLMVDAICGIGLTHDLRPDVASLVDTLNSIKIPMVALDIPTGIDADTGRVCGSAIQADVTITFIGLKLGLLTGEGASCAGHVWLDRLDIADNVFASVSAMASVIRLAPFIQYLEPRLKNWHKGLSGHVLVVGGDEGYAGAPHMAAEAALRVGAGLVSVATHPANTQAIQVNRPEIMVHGITQAAQLAALIEKASVLVVGPGLGQSAWSDTLWQAVASVDKPMLLDADGLNCLAKHKKHHKHWVLTPHPGEAARLLGQTAEMIAANRLKAVQTIQQTYGGICVLKGAGTLISDGNALPALCDKGNPGMATAGMGDVLSGVIGGLMAQHIPLFAAAQLGVYLHAAAGDMAAKAGQRGTVATDLMPYLRHLVNLGG